MWAKVLLLLALFAERRVTGQHHLHEITDDELIDDSKDFWYDKLSESELSKYWSSDDGTSILGKLHWLSNVTLSIPIQVRLVGFEQIFSPGSLKQVFERYLKAIRVHENLKFPIGEESSKFKINVELNTHVSLASRSLNGRLSDALTQQLKDLNANEKSEKIHFVPFETVDNLIKEDYENKGHGRYFIYLVLPSTPKSILYSYYMGSNTCASEIWISQGTSQRYIWVDLRAKAATRYPTISGLAGAVLNASGPGLEPLQRPKDADQFRPAKFLPPLAALTTRILRLAILPTASFFPRYPSQDVEVEILLISDDRNESKNSAQKWVENAVGRYNSFRDMLGSLALPQQKFRVRVSGLSTSTCSACAEGISEATKNYLGGKFLDSAILRRHLAPYVRARKGIPGRTKTLKGNPDESQVRLYTLVVLGLERSILLDTRMQAIAFDDMSIAVESTTNRRIPSNFACIVTSQMEGSANPISPSWKTRTSQVDTGNAVAASYQSLLRGLLGISNPIEVPMNLHSNKDTELDLLISTAGVCFGPFLGGGRHDSRGNHTGVLENCQSFVEMDAAMRIAAISEFAATSRSIFSSLKRIHGFASKEDESILLARALQGRLLEYRRRWNVYKFKIERAFRLLSQLNFASGISLLTSAHHDANEMRILFDSVENIHSRSEANPLTLLVIWEALIKILCFIAMFVLTYYLLGIALPEGFSTLIFEFGSKRMSRHRWKEKFHDD